MLVLPGHIFRGKEVNCMICITITVCLEMAMMDNCKIKFLFNVHILKVIAHELGDITVVF